MGLDMYLHKRTCVKNWNWMKPEDRLQITVLEGGKPAKIKPERVCGISEEVAHWREANAIHQWFVDDVQDGHDNCADYRVSDDQLRDLLEACREVLKASKLVDGQVANGYAFANGEKVPIIEDGKIIENPSKAADLLPVEDGFRFGGIGYDESYLEDIEYTKNVLEQLLAEEPDGEYYYSSSW